MGPVGEPSRGSPFQTKTGRWVKRGASACVSIALEDLPRASPKVLGLEGESGGRHLWPLRWDRQDMEMGDEKWHLTLLLPGLLPFLLGSLQLATQSLMLWLSRLHCFQQTTVSSVQGRVNRIPRDRECQTKFCSNGQKHTHKRASCFLHRTQTHRLASKVETTFRSEMATGESKGQICTPLCQ